MPGQATPTANTSLWSLLRPRLGVWRSLRALIGSAIMHLLFQGRAPLSGLAYLDTLAVREQTRGSGVGSRLLAHCCEQARLAGCDEIALHVVDTNPRARKLYERTGFVLRHERGVRVTIADFIACMVAQATHFSRAYLMVKDLNQP